MEVYWDWSTVRLVTALPWCSTGSRYTRGCTSPRIRARRSSRCAKLAFVNRLSKELAEAVNMGFAKVPVKGSCQSPRNAFVEANWDNGSIVWAEREHGRVNCAEGEDREPSQEDGAEVDGMGGVVSELRRTYPIITL